MCGRTIRETNPRSGKLYLECVVCRKRRKAHTEELKKAGICRDCYGPSNGHTRCTSCIRRMKELTIARGACQNCGRKNDQPEMSVCTRCVIRTIARRNLGDSSRVPELLELFGKQEGKCALSAVSIALGQNASIDHIIPTNRGGTNDITNLRWVHIAVNRMKHDMLDVELLEWAERVVANKTNLRLDARADPSTKRKRNWPRYAK